MPSHMPVAQTTPPAPPALRSATLIAPRLLPVCCVCGLIRDETRSLHRERWVSPRTYRQTHGVHSTQLAQTHTYCPACFTKAQETMQQYFREIRSAAIKPAGDSLNAGAARQATDLAPRTQPPVSL